MPCNSGQCREQKTRCLCGNCKPLQRSATTDRALVKRVGKRFESARRLFIFALDKPNTQNRGNPSSSSGLLYDSFYDNATGVRRWPTTDGREVKRKGRRRSINTNRLADAPCSGVCRH